MTDSIKKPLLFFVFLVISSFLLLVLLHPWSKRSSISKSSAIPSPTPEVKKIPSTPYLSAHGTKLYLNGEEFQFTGANAFHLGTLPGVNAGCGGEEKDLDAFFLRLRPNSVVRMWAFQGGMATNVTTKEIDWSGLDRVVNAAQKNRVKLILVLGDQSGTCDDGHWKDRAWYEGGYKKPVNDLNNGLTPLSYLEYVKLIVHRYKDSTTIAMWEPMNEPESSDCKNEKGSACYTKQTCTNEVAAAKALRSFFDTVGAEIKKIDTNHIVSSGVIGEGQCGAIFEDYKSLHESASIDIASYHDYQREDQPMPGDQWNGLQKRLDQMKAINKPLFIGEVGMKAAAGTNKCMDLPTRNKKIQAKMDAQFAAGIVGFLPWSLTGGNSKICNFDVGPTDPILKLLERYPIEMGTFSARLVGTNSATLQLTNPDLKPIQLVLPPRN